jgi:hypothetical protein
MTGPTTSDILGLLNNEYTDEFGTDNDLEVTGGGRGWTATTTRNEVEVSAKGVSKIGAADNLRLALALAQATDDEAGEDEDDLDFDDMTEGEAAQCVAECVGSKTAYCACKCDGRNHGAGAGSNRAFKAVLGQKLCKCGCGEVTKRTYVPGHDARHHGALKLAAWVQANSFVGTEEEARKARLAQQRKAARDRKAALLAEQVARVAEVLPEHPVGASRS